MNIVHSPGSVPDGTVYGTHVSEVDSSDGGQFEHTVTDLTPGNVSKKTFCPEHEPKLPILTKNKNRVSRFGSQSLITFAFVSVRHLPCQRHTEKLSHIERGIRSNLAAYQPFVCPPSVQTCPAEAINSNFFTSHGRFISAVFPYFRR